MRDALFNIIVAVVMCLCALQVSSVAAQEFRYGLEFYSFETPQEKRTSLNLTPGKPFKFPDGFTLSFDMLCQPDLEYNFGYIFRIIGQNNHYIDFLINMDNLQVINSEDKVLTEFNINEVAGGFLKFFSFGIRFVPKSGELTINAGDMTFSPNTPYIKDFKTVNIIFGKCLHALLETTDVPKIIVKDIRINNAKNEPIYHWALSSHAHNGVYDELRRRFATVENPNWLLDRHAFWQKRQELSLYRNPQIAYNPVRNLIAIADSNKFILYDTKTHSIIRNDQSKGVIQSGYSNGLIYSPFDSNYYSYNLNMTFNDYTIAAYDTVHKDWGNQITSMESRIDFWHHNRLLSLIDSCLYTFNGYGHHRYKNVINRYSFKTKEWTEIQYRGSKVPPRYMSAFGLKDSAHALLFGGYGNETGLQELSPRNYYDLYEIDLRSMTAKKIREMEPPKDNFSVANSLITDTLHNCFYALCFPHQQFNTKLTLTRFSTETLENEIVSDAIPFEFRDILSYADLFLNKETNELSAITFSASPNDSMSLVSIYSLIYPPISIKAVYQDFNKPYDAKMIIFTLIFAALVASVILFIRRKRNKQALSAHNENVALSTQEHHSPLIRPLKQAVLLFGGFRVMNREGADVTDEFSPLIKQLFLLILMNTLEEDSKGVSSTKLKETLWFDKSIESARNNRGVMLNKIRQIFEHIGTVVIEGQNSYWTVKMGDEIYCDYKEAITLIKALKHRINRTKANVERLVNIVSTGELLPNTQTEWVDSFKSDFANSLVDLLLDISKQPDLNLSPKEMINLADAIGIHDILNEDALRLKCSALFKMGKIGLAKTTFNTFTKEYASLFGKKYTVSFEQIVA
ncbi:MAG: hypothetical protein LBR84_07555 [Tannerella sp.]|jgi:two-component SAPR family response regulator|nr:hypothetical protein [Tannerella sp.]